MNRVIYRNIINLDGSVADPESIQSDVFVQFYLESATGCYYNDDPQACQTLVNPCALQLYDETTSACKLVHTILNDSNKAYNWVPEVYYDQTP